MVQRCKNCGERIIRFPMWQGQERGKPFSWDKINLVNLFKIDFYTLMWVAVMIFLIIAYKSDIKKCEDAIRRPCEFCEDTGCYDRYLMEVWKDITEEERNELDYKRRIAAINRNLVDIKDIPNFNLTVE